MAKEETKAKKSTWDPVAADNAASDAENELSELSDEQVNGVANWWYKFYMKTGHKRLGRIIAAIGKENAEKAAKQSGG